MTLLRILLTLILVFAGATTNLMLQREYGLSRLEGAIITGVALLVAVAYIWSKH